ncbi:MAG: hypothetical protein ACFE9X_08925 [Promethearchaeota archaeon]
MEIQYGKMILHGILSAIFYLVVPLVLFYFLELYGIMTFTDTYRTAIIIFGIIGIIISMLSHAFPVDTPANRLIRFGITVYSGIFLFYIFGGFDPGTTLGTYYIDMTYIQVLLGLKVIAWLLLGSTIIRGLQYLIEAIELRKKKEYRVKVKREFKVSKIFKVLGIFASLAIVGYFGSIIYSGANLRVNLQQPIPPPAYDDGGTPGIYGDDSLNITISFDVSNMGLYAINDVVLNAEIHVVTSSDPILLPFDTTIGSSPVPYQNTFHSFTQTFNQNITISINTAYIEGLLTATANLLFKIMFSTLYAWIFVNLTISFPVPWP